MQSTEATLQRLLAEALVPGVAAAHIRDGKVEQFLSCGVRSAQAPAAIDEDSVFEAASLSKPVFAYVVLQLVDQGRLQLDSRLGDHVASHMTGDPRAASVTVRHALSHTTGLPNWRNADYPLRTYFPPGTRFSYSGEGFLYLQKAIEAVTGEKLPALAQKLVFEPLGMTRSGFVWQPEFDGNRAYPHDAFGMPALGNKPAEANAAWSLQSSVSDYARFPLAALEGARLKPETARDWLTSHIEIRHRGTQRLEPEVEDAATQVAWGLGWGIEADAGTFFHWGDNGPFTSFTVGSATERTALVIFTNGASGHSIMRELVAEFVPGERASLAWLGYTRHDSPVRRSLRAALANGIESAWPEIEHAALDKGELRWIAQGLNARGRQADCQWLRARTERAAEG